MSSLFNGDWHTRPVRWSLAVAALLACGSAHAQDVLEEDALAAAVQGRAYTGTTPLRLEHRTRGYAQEASDTAVGGRIGIVDMTDAVGFADGQFRINNESRVGVNTGLGYRWYSDVTGFSRVLGVSGWYDGQETVNENYFNQLGVSFESLGELLDLRLNANIPLEDQKLGERVFLTDAINYFGNNIGQQTLTPADTPLRVVDAEVAARVFDLNIWVFGGVYQMDGDDVSETGAKGGVRGYLTNDLLVGVTVTDDQEFGTNTIAQVIWTPGRTGAGPTSWVHGLADRMREHVYRNTYVATSQSFSEGSVLLTDASGEAIRVVHVNSAAGTATGDGTIENPINSLDLIDDTSQAGDIILVHAGTSGYDGQTARLVEQQRLLGEGGGNTHTVVTAQRGTITLPETFSGATDAARPTIEGGAGTTSVLLAGTTADNAAFSAIEVSNFDFRGGATAIASDVNGVGSVNINRLMIEDSTDDAIKLAALTEELSNGTERVRFTPTINQVRFEDIGGDDIELTSVTEPAANLITETITVSNINSQRGEGVGVNLQGLRRTATLSNITWTGDAASDGAVRVESAGASANVTLNGTNTIAGPAALSATPDSTGYAIALANSNGSMTVTGTTITNTPGDSILINGGAMNLTFTGRIDQANAASVVSVQGAHTGTVNFNELTAAAGVINATAGDGFRFDNADGTYRFNHNVTLATGVTDGIEVRNGSAGTFNFTDADVTLASGEAVNIFLSDVNTFTISGDINASGTARPVRIVDNTGGDVTINSVITSSGAGVLVDGNTDTTILFAGQTTLNTTTNTGVELTDNANGSVRFNALDVTTTSGVAFTATNTDNLSVQGTGNTLATGTSTVQGGVALNLNDVQVATGGVNFASIDVTDGSSNGVVLNDVRGNGVSVGSTGANPGDGGTIAAADEAILITNAVNVSVNNMDLSSATAQAVSFNVTNSATSRLLLNNNDIDNTAAGAAESVLLSVSGTASTANITLRGNNIRNSDDEAVLLTTSGPTLKTVNLLVENNENIQNSSALAGAPAGSFQAGSATTLNATVRGNQFQNTDGGGSGRPFEMAALAGATVHLDLNSNTASGAGDEYFLIDSGTDFFVEDLAGTAAGTRNTSGTVNFTPNQAAFTEEPGTIPTP